MMPAMNVYQKTGLSFELQLAQFALETGWGAYVLPDTNNLFNIKADKAWRGPKKTFKVREFLEGKWVYVNADFRVYETLEHSLEDRVNFLKSNPRYARLFQSGILGVFAEEAKELQRAGYATDPYYADALIGVYNCRTMRRALSAFKEKWQK